ncbi:MAG: DUF2182 domain-containing protein [Aestuariivirgaceae bacterium]
MRSSQLDAGGTILEPKAWSASHAAAMFIMWWVMTVAMMIPSASPAVLTFAATTRKLRNRANAYVPTGLFLAGYLAIWGVFGWAATIFQWGLEQSGLMSAAMFTPDSKLAGALFIGAGLYQLSGFKQRCLRHCQEPHTYFNGNWRQGPFGALSLGMAHGGFCLGCSRFLMALLFVGGILNVFWITGLAAYVFLEKYLRHGSLLSIVAGCVLTCWGMLVMVTTW